MAAKSAIPWPYWLYHLYIEPVMALIGAYQAAFLPFTYLSTFTSRSVVGLTTDATIAASPFQAIFDQTAACYALFAFNEAVLLRVADNNVKIWKAVVAGIATCDILHLCGARRAMGSEAFWNPLLWRANDWIAVGTLWLPLALRLAFLAGVGVSPSKKQGKKR
jgi:hypothetical protein